MTRFQTPRKSASRREVFAGDVRKHGGSPLLAIGGNDLVDFWEDPAHPSARSRMSRVGVSLEGVGFFAVRCLRPSENAVALEEREFLSFQKTASHHCGSDQRGSLQRSPEL